MMQQMQQLIFGGLQDKLNRTMLILFYSCLEEKKKLRSSGVYRDLAGQQLCQLGYQASRSHSLPYIQDQCRPNIYQFSELRVCFIYSTTDVVDVMFMCDENPQLKIPIKTTNCMYVSTV